MSGVKGEEEGYEEEDGRIKTVENFKLLISYVAMCFFLCRSHLSVQIVAKEKNWTKR
jgi:hypothetical protein